jgi:preprotein translocase subunit SecF
MINFIRFKKYYFIFSATLVLISLTSLAVWRVKPSIDFTGGSLFVVKIDNVQNNDDIKNIVQGIEGFEINSIQKQNDSNEFFIKSKAIDDAKKNEVVAKLEEKFGKIEISRFETVGPVLGSELLFKTFVAVLIAASFILFYVARQFKDRAFGISAILAMFHDTLILFGAFSLFGKFLNVEVDTLFVTAVLTTLSFSVHDTIVVFDRIREQSQGSAVKDINTLVNTAVSQTLSRSLNNSMTIIFMLTSLVVLGGETIRWFAVALLIGTILGTYSSAFLAVPLLTVLKNKNISSK